MKSENATFSDAVDNLLKVTYREVNCIAKECGGDGQQLHFSLLLLLPERP